MQSVRARTCDTVLFFPFLYISILLRRSHGNKDNQAVLEVNLVQPDYSCYNGFFALIRHKKQECPFLFFYASEGHPRPTASANPFHAAMPSLVHQS